MITFLSKIRKKLLTENKFTQYLLYAIGEIVLVVLGILIAFQIENWSDTQKDLKTEQQLLLDIYQVLETDISQLDDISLATDLRLMRLDSVLIMLNDPQFDEKQFFSGLTDYAFDSYFESNTAVFDEAVSSGTISLIRDKELLELIFSYYANAKSNSQDKSTRKTTDEIISPSLINTYLNKDGFEFFIGLGFFENDILNSLDLKTFNKDELKSNREFWNMVLTKKLYGFTQMRNWNKKKELAEALQLRINESL